VLAYSFGGGNVMEDNLLANFVRETGDHGPFNVGDYDSARTPP
jgi:hypothetical protein